MNKNDYLLRQKDLVDNPMTRVPICLCLDTSASMGRVVDGEVINTGQKEYIDGRLWDIVTGGVTAIDEMSGGVKAFYDELHSDEVAKYSAEVCIITFGGVKPKLVTDFANIERQNELPRFSASGDTPMGEAVNLALNCLEKRKQEYKDKGVDYFQPWLVLMTDGEPNGDPDELKRAVNRTTELVKARKLTVFPIGIGEEADMEALARFSPKFSPKKVKETKFKEFFQWLSQSVSAVSQSMPGENIPLPETHGWEELEA